MWRLDLTSAEAYRVGNLLTQNHRLGQMELVPLVRRLCRSLTLSEIRGMRIAMKSQTHQIYTAPLPAYV